MNRPKPTPSHPTASRRGSVLLFVMVVVVVLTLALYAFVDQSRVEYAASMRETDQIASRRIAEGGIEYTLGVLDDPNQLAAGPLEDRADLFASIPVISPGTTTSDDPRTVPLLSVYSIDYRSTAGPEIRFGLANESRKIPLAAVASLEDEDQAREVLLLLPGMDEFLADAILDWIDEDETPREFGAELEYYSGVDPPVSPPNELPRFPEELLPIRDMTPELLFGEDTNANGELDPSEDDGELSPPLDNADGLLDGGLVEYLGLTGREQLRNSLGDPKININAADLAQLHSDLSVVLEPGEANFIVMLRVFGATGGSDSGGGRGPSVSPLDPANFPIEDLLTMEPKSEIRSLYDLFDAKVQVGGGRRGMSFSSPWSSEPDLLAATLPVLNDELTTVSGTSRPARLDLNAATREQLIGWPKMTEEMVELIVGSQMVPVDTTPTIDQTIGRLHLLAPDLFPLSLLSEWDAYFGGPGDVHEAIVLGQAHENAPLVRYRVLFDSSRQPSRVLRAVQVKGELNLDELTGSTAVPGGFSNGR